MIAHVLCCVQHSSPVKSMLLVSNCIVLTMIFCRAACASTTENVLAVIAALFTCPYFLFFCRYMHSSYTVKNIRISTDILWRVFHILTEQVTCTFVSANRRNNEARCPHCNVDPGLHYSVNLRNLFTISKRITCR